MVNIDFLATSITERYGTIKRARGCFLYTAKRTRLTDLYQEGGRAILGWGSAGGNYYTILKNILSRGICGSFDTDFTPLKKNNKSQISKAVSELIGEERRVLLFSSHLRAVSSSTASFGKYTDYYPWAEPDVDWKKEDVLIIVPPLPWTDSIAIVAIKPEVEAKESLYSDRIPAPLCAAATRSIHDLIKAIQEREEKNWFIYDTVLTKYWTRKGPYLYPKVPKEKYKDFLLHCLDCGIVISPFYKTPSIVPFGADIGNFSKLKANPFAY